MHECGWVTNPIIFVSNVHDIFVHLCAFNMSYMCINKLAPRFDQNLLTPPFLPIIQEALLHIYSRYYQTSREVKLKKALSLLMVARIWLRNIMTGMVLFLCTDLNKQVILRRSYKMVGNEYIY